MTTVAEEKGYEQLSAEDANAFLARHHTGRIAFSLHDRVDIQPISYSFDRGWITGRTSIGTTLSVLAHNPWCAFEVDEVWSPFEWTSVVAKGMFYLLDPETSSPDVYSRALASVRSLIPDAFSPSDPLARRDILFGIQANSITGRRTRRRLTHRGAADE